MDDTQPSSPSPTKNPMVGPDRPPENDGGLFTGQGLVCVRGGRTVFEGLDFALKSGDALVLLGANGSGKSSLLRIMADLLKPTAGNLLWCGYAVADDPESHHIRQHYVGHLDGLKTSMTVRENLSFWTGLRMGEAPPPGLIRNALGSFGLDYLADFPVGILSAGQKRRLSLARMLASSADLWLLDEPTVALDRNSITALKQAIARHRRRGGMVVVATHSKMALGRSWSLYLDRFAPRSGLAELREDATTVLGNIGRKSARKRGARG